jgi:predicted RNA-binding protein YlqC (UPF0109 family)
MSSFDDEFGLFGEEAEEAERRSTLGARKIATSETIIDDIEPEDEAPRRRTGAAVRAPGLRKGPGGKGRRHEKPHREPVDPQAARERAAALLDFLARKLVEKPDAVIVDNFPPENGEQASIELIVDPDDIGKVIGRNGRVAQALRTIVRATAEGKVAVEIFDTNDLTEDEEELEEDAIDSE